MRKRNVLAAFLLVCLLILWIPADVQATTEDGLDFALTADGKSYIISSCDKEIKGELTLPETYNGKPVIGIGEHAFADCNALTCVNIPGSIVSIGKSAFARCIRLDKVVMAEGVSIIEAKAFENCIILRDIFVPQSMTYMGADAFYKCENTCVHIESVSAWCSITFENGEANPMSAYLPVYIDGFPKLSLVIPADVKTVSDYAFYRCGAFATVVISDGVETIGKYAFANSASICDVILPESVTKLGEYAFANCGNLLSVHLPKTVTSMGAGAFSGCEKLRISYDGTPEDWQKAQKGYPGMGVKEQIVYTSDLPELLGPVIESLKDPVPAKKQLTVWQIRSLIYFAYYGWVILSVYTRKKANKARVRELLREAMEEMEADNKQIDGGQK